MKKFVLILLVVLSCTPDEPFFKPLSLPLQYESAHFKFYFDNGLTKAQIAPIEEKLEEKYDLIVDRLQPSPFPKMKIALWSERSEFDEAMNNRYPGAAGYVNGKEEVRLLFTGSSYLPQGAVHEFVHAVTLFLSEDAGNNPRWLWESVAQYESDTYTDLKMLPYMVSGDYPTLNDLTNETGTNQRIYPLGYSITEFIVETWGYEKLRALIKSHGNIQSSLGISEQMFEEQWYTFIEERYLN